MEQLNNSPRQRGVPTPAQIFNKMFKNGLLSRNNANRNAIASPPRTSKLRRKGTKHLFNMNSKDKVKDKEFDWNEISPVTRHEPERLASNPSEHSLKNLLKEESFHSDEKASDKDEDLDWRAGGGFGGGFGGGGFGAANEALNADSNKFYGEFGADYDRTTGATGGSKRPKKQKMPSKFSNRLKPGGG